MTPITFFERWGNAFWGLLGSESTAFAWVLGAFALCAIVEFVFPAEPGQRWAGRARNLVYMAVYVCFGLGALSLWYAGISSDPTPRHHAQLVENLYLLPAYLFAGDFAYYWYHRAQHRYRPLWAVHELHHADTELNITTSYRTFWLEAPVQSVVVGGPVVWAFGIPGAHFALSATILTRSVLLLAHCNFRWSFGRLTPLLCGPQWHRIHHSRLAQHQDRNFAQVFPIIDWLFGTYYAPARDEYPPTGTDGLRADESIWRAQLRPLVLWKDQIAGVFGRRAVP